jgi:hypothetical protein
MLRWGDGASCAFGQLPVASDGTCPSGTLTTRAQLLDFLRAHRHAVQASVSAAWEPQAKARNLRRRAALALVFGGTAPGEEWTSVPKDVLAVVGPGAMTVSRRRPARPT